MLAVRASEALSRLGGLFTDENLTPHNQGAMDALRALLTAKLASMLKDQVPRELLSTLNTNFESPEENTDFFLVSGGEGERLICLNPHPLQWYRWPIGSKKYFF